MDKLVLATALINENSLPSLDKGILGLLQMNGGLALYCLVVTLFSLIISGIIGVERELRGHAAGLRTHIMVSLGATLIMSVSMGSLYQNPNADPYRVAAQVVSGIGFLGAGTIMQTSTDIKGLTTASTLWLCGGIGLACGAGFITEALIVAGFSLFVLLMLGLIERSYSKFSPSVVIITDDGTPFLKKALEIADHFDCYIVDIDSSMITYRQRNCVKIVLNFRKDVTDSKLRSFADELKEAIHPFELKVMSSFSRKKHRSINSNNKKK